jgi:hypothetical protein
VTIIRNRKHVTPTLWILYTCGSEVWLPKLWYSLYSMLLIWQHYNEKFMVKCTYHLSMRLPTPHTLYL